jgi:tRNA threonylcarbamoyladenosine biosynthesis protein TsaE
MQHLHKIQDLAGMRLMAEEIVLHLPNYPIVLLKGDLGAGKTTLAQMICEILGVKESVTSPTYTLVNEYIVADKSIYHFDLYRLKNTEELEGIGFSEYIDSGNICLIEWPELAEKYFIGIPSITVSITSNGTERELVIQQQSITA